MLILIYTLLIVFAFVSFYVTWRFADFFLSRRDYYRNSPYELLKMKLKFSATVALTPLVLWFLVFQKMYNNSIKLKEEIKNKSTKELIFYSKPNIDSEILFKGELDYFIDDSTEYFYKIKSKNFNAYLLKTNL